MVVVAVLIVEVVVVLVVDLAVLVVLVVVGARGPWDCLQTKVEMRAGRNGGGAKGCLVVAPFDGRQTPGAV